jgi:hypothetical protein
MNNLDFVAILKDIALNYKTLYVMGCFGAPMNATNKKRYTQNHEYNKKSARTKMIITASSDTFGFDCVCLIKGVLWGWCGDTSKKYGGADYASNGVPDIGTESIINVCSSVSTDFNNIEIGELVWMKGHVGIYIGDGLAVECTPSWENKVQITACNKSIKGYKRRNWTKHGRLPYIDYVVLKKDEPAISVWEWQKAAVKDGFSFPKYGCDGEWGAECEAVAKKAICKKRLLSYKYPNLTRLVQKAVGVTVDGKFGKDTKAAVIKWQKLMGLIADGAVGINTWKKILGVK